MTSNANRARWAQRCAEHYARLTGVDDAEDAIVDLMASLGHYVDSLDLDYLHLVAIAIGHWHVEQTDPESMDALPLVTIQINESKTR